MADDLSKRLFELSDGFASRFMYPVLRPYVGALCQTIERSRTLDASKGAPKNIAIRWACSKMKNKVSYGW